MAGKKQYACTKWGKCLDFERVPFLFTYVDRLTMDDTVRLIDRRIQNRQQTQHVVINAGKVVLMNSDSELRDIVNACPIINADGQSIVWASAFLGHRLPERVTGIDLMYRLLELSVQKGYRVYLFGAKEEVVAATKLRFEEKYPGLQIAGYRNGYFTDDDQADIVADMRAANADILLIAFSSPKKELWVRDHIDEIAIPFVMGVGGSFDIVAGVTRRAPLWMQKTGLEWLYRFIQEPRRMFDRYVKGNIRFARIVLRYRMEKGRV